MAHKKYALSGLPVVSKRTIKRFINESVSEPYVYESVELLKSENHFLIEFLEDIMESKVYDQQTKSGYIGGFCAAYTLLRLQSEEYKNE